MTETLSPTGPFLPVHELLREAAEHVLAVGLCKNGDYWDMNAPAPTRVIRDAAAQATERNLFSAKRVSKEAEWAAPCCTLGSVLQVNKHRMSSYEHHPRYHEISNVLNRLAHRRYGLPVVSWNDQMATTKEVAALLREAADLFEADKTRELWP